MMIARASGTLWLMAQNRTVNGARSRTESSVTSFNSTTLSRPCSSSFDLAKASVRRLP